MCLILAAYKVHKKYPLIILANRDEYYERPTKNAHYWTNEPTILAGKDLKAGGTWLGITNNGKFCALTNYREPSNFRSDAVSRGQLVSTFLKPETNQTKFYSQFLKDPTIYNDFNLLTYEDNLLTYFSSKANERKTISPGIYGLSNASLDSQWPKVTQGKKDLGALIENSIITQTDAFNILENTSVSSDDLLPKTGISLDFERLLSAMHIKTKGYGTRSANVILFGKNKIEFHEKDYLENKEQFFEIKL